MKSLERLYEASEAAQQLEEMLHERDGDITGAELQFDALTEKAGSINAAVDDVISLVRDIESRAEARADEADRLKARARRDADIAKWFKSQVLRVMTERGLKTIETPRFRLTASMPGGKQALSIVGEVPEQFTRQVTTVETNTDAIRAELDSGKTLDFAYYAPKQPYLRIS
jgi:hypothetical protein